MTDICVSGGADGADLEWGEVAAEAGHTVLHVSFDGHHTNALPKTIYKLTADGLMSGRFACSDAASLLGKRWPPSSAYIRNLLLRNYQIIRSASSLYAVAPIGGDWTVQGGTGWGVQMFLARGDIDKDNAPLWVFDTETDWWMTPDVGGGWRVAAPPRPTGIYAAIGTRAYNNRACTAIRDLFFNRKF